MPTLGAPPAPAAHRAYGRLRRPRYRAEGDADTSLGMSSLPPDVLAAIRTALGDHYEIERELGAGAMGSVLLAHDRTLERPVAVKIINPELAATSTFRQRFLQEARTIAKLRHGNIVGVHAAGEAGGVLYFVMEFVEGESLRDLLERDGALPAARAAAILRELADALGYAHKAGVIHRDIKPENILIDRMTGHARLTDFGIARSLAAAGDRMTGTGMSVGTPAYMSPEQASGERDIDGRSDLYSLALVGYEMLAGTPAFTGKTSGSVIMKQITEQPAPLIEQAVNVPPALAAVIEKALAKDPDERWPDGESMARAIDAALAGAEVPGLGTPRRSGIDATGAAGTRSSASGEHRRRRAPVALIAVILLAVVVPLAWFAMGARSGVPSGVDPRRSFLVVPFRVQGSDPSLAWLRDGSVGMLALNLAQWRDISVVEYERSLDLLRDAELDGDRDISLQEALDLAKRAGAWTVVMGDVTRIGDSVGVTARLFAVESGARIRDGDAQARAPASADPRPLFDAIANQLLDLVGAPPVEMALMKTTTGSLEAYRHYLAGVRALNEWRLSAADSALAQAVIADSTFALAWYKRSLANGWRRANDSNTVNYARKALTFASRLPTRERGLVEGNFEQQQQNWGAAQQRYRQLLASDSTDAEAWYALADAYYHDPAAERRAANLTASLAAFKRTLELDSTFHLAYSHKIDLYSEGSRPGSAMLIENDTVRLLSAAEAQQLGRPRVEAARLRSQELAIRNAEQWVYTDQDAPTAYFALAEAYAAARNYARAAETLERAMARPTTRQADFPYRIASYQLGAGSPAALESLRRALREQTADSLRQRSTARRFNNMLAATNVALAAGAMADAEAMLARVIEVDPNLPGTERAPRPIPTAMMLSSFRTAVMAGADLETTGADTEIRPMVKQLEAIPGPPGEQTRQQSVQIAFAGYMLTRDTTYFGVIRRWAKREPPPAFLSLAAIEAGDTATAARIARQFRRGDTTGLITSPESESLTMFEAEVLARIGDLRGALATLERMNPKDFVPTNLDPRWAFYPRALVERGALHERLGEPERADSLYSQAIALWTDADAKGQSLVETARRRLAALRDAPPRAGRR